MKSLFFTEEHELFRKSLKDFFKLEVLLYLDEWEAQGKIDRNIFRKMGKMGYLDLEVEEAYEGTGLDFLYSTILCEEMGRIGFLGFSTAMSGHFKEKYLVSSVNEEIVGSPSMTEPFAGSDVKGKNLGIQ